MFSQFVDQWTKGLTDKEEKAKGLRFILSSILDLQVLLLCKLTILYYHFRMMINVFYSGGNKFVVFFFLYCTHKSWSQNQGKIWNVLVLRFSKHPLHVQFDLNLKTSRFQICHWFWKLTKICMSNWAKQNIGLFW